MVDRKKLVEKRHALGITKVAMAEMLGISESSYGRKETGATSFKEDEMLALISALNLSIGEIQEILFVNDPDSHLEIDDTRYFDVGLTCSHLSHFNKDFEVVDEDGRKLCGYEQGDHELILKFD